jgi:hypothetical protein
MFDQLLLVRSLACKCGHGPNVHRGKCELCDGESCAGFDPSPLRRSADYPNLKDFWIRVSKAGLSHEDVDELISGSLTFYQAHTLQRNAALENSGKEIPAHLDFKNRLPVGIQLEVQQLEADRKKWGNRKLKRKLDSLWRELKEVLESPTLCAHVPLEVIEAAEAMARTCNGESQSELRKELRNMALIRMVAATGLLHWDLISLAVYLASGERLHLEEDSFRREYNSLSSKAVKKLAGKYCLPVPRRRVLVEKQVKSPRD